MLGWKSPVILGFFLAWKLSVSTIIVSVQRYLYPQWRKMNVRNEEKRCGFRPARLPFRAMQFPQFTKVNKPKRKECWITVH